MPKSCVKKKMEGGMSRKAAVKACYSDTAKAIAKGAVVGAATAGAAGLEGGKKGTIRKGKTYRGAVAGGALMGAMAGYGASKRKKKKKK
tara:strand:+ start:215 stop:481 length:267 start_codon:yes stop_codon:yes gene_type:complete